MSSMLAWRQLKAGLIALLCCALWVGPATAQQQPSEAAVKAGFIVNFVKFTQWGPARDNDPGPIQLCAPGTQPLEGQFAKLSGRLIGTRKLEVRTNVMTSEWRGCDVLFIGEADSSRLDTVLRAVEAAPVLTVGDFPGFTKAGGMIGLRMDDNRLKFDVNLGSAQRSGLLLNSQMVKLAGQVIK